MTAICGPGESPIATMDESFHFIDTVQTVFADDPQVYKDFRKLLRGYLQKIVSASLLIDAVSELFRDHRDLLVGFNQFVYEAESLGLGTTNFRDEDGIDTAFSSMVTGKDRFAKAMVRHNAVPAMMTEPKIKAMEVKSNNNDSNKNDLLGPVAQWLKTGFLKNVKASTKIQIAEAKEESKLVSFKKLSVDVLFHDWVAQVVTSKQAANACPYNGNFLHEAQSTQAAKNGLREFGGALAELNEALKSGYLRSAKFYKKIGLIMHNLNIYDGALVEFKKVQAIREALLGKEHPKTASCYHKMGHILFNQENYDDSLVELEKAATIYEAVLEKDDPKTARLNNLIVTVLYKQGSVLFKQGNYTGALVKCRKCLEIEKILLGKDLIDTVIWYDYIGLLLFKQGNYDDALVEHKKALAIREAILGKRHPHTATSYNNIGCVLTKQGNYEDALVEFRKALAIEESVLGKDHPDTARSYENIGVALELQGFPSLT